MGWLAAPYCPGAPPCGAKLGACCWWLCTSMVVGDGAGAAPGDVIMIMVCGGPASSLALASSSLASSSVRRVLSGHHGCLWHCAWSRDDALVIACGAGSEVSVWDSATGQLRLLCESGHREALHSAYFVDGDRAFVTSSPDKQILVRDMQGALLHRWSADVSTDMHVTHNQRFILAATQHSALEAFDVKSKRRTQSAAHTTARSDTARSRPPPGPSRVALVGRSIFCPCASLALVGSVALRVRLCTVACRWCRRVSSPVVRPLLWPPLLRRLLRFRRRCRPRCLLCPPSYPASRCRTTTRERSSQPRSRRSAHNANALHRTAQQLAEQPLMRMRRLASRSCHVPP